MLFFLKTRSWENVKSDSYRNYITVILHVKVVKKKKKENKTKPITYVDPAGL